MAVGQAAGPSAILQMESFADTVHLEARLHQLLMVQDIAPVKDPTRPTFHTIVQLLIVQVLQKESAVAHKGELA